MNFRVLMDSKNFKKNIALKAIDPTWSSKIHTQYGVRVLRF